MSTPPPGVYMGKDGEEYQVFTDGSTYRRTYGKKWRTNLETGLREQYRTGPTLRRVGHAREKVDALESE